MSEILKHYLASQFAIKLYDYNEVKRILLGKAYHPDEIKEVYDLILEFDAIGQKAFYNKYRDKKLY